MGIIEKNQQLEELDKQYIWHPFTQMKEWLEEKPVIISEGRNSFIKDIYGNWYLDGVSSLWVNVHGHRKAEIDDAIKEQIDSISHSTMLGLSNVPAIKLAERLIQIIKQSTVSGHRSETEKSKIQNPKSKIKDTSALVRVFYSDNGSTAVEVSLKMAFQYWRHKGLKNKNSFLALNNAYHGDTLGAVSVGGVDIFHDAFGPLLFKTFKAPSPHCYRCELALTFPACRLACLDKMRALLQKNADRIAAVIIEPLVQAAGGMLVSPPGYLKGVRELCSRYNVLMIADEVATGFGRTGKMFACEHEGVSPDIMCISKGITGGYLPLAATLATDEIYSAFLGDYQELKTFFHGHSYTGNPLACAAALACLNIFDREETIKKLQPKIEMLELFLKSVSVLDHVGNVRSRGLMAGIELVKNKATKEPYPLEEKMGWRVADYARKKGVFIRPLGNVIVLMPPLSIDIENLEHLLKIIKTGLVEIT